MDVVLYGVGRNLNRAYRTCEAFGGQSLLLYRCNPKLSGNLFKAVGRVRVQSIDEWPEAEGTLALETWGDVDIADVDWSDIRRIVVGGETTGLPRKVPAQCVARIPMTGNISGLTVEAALAIALYRWRLNA